MKPLRTLQKPLWNSVVKCLYSIVLVSSIWTNVCAQNAPSIVSPKHFLGYEIGSFFTYHHKIVQYFESTDALSDNVVVQQYGVTPEKRPLIAAFISSANNLQQLEQIRQNNLIHLGVEKGTATRPFVPVVWLKYGVHGNEPASSEAAMQTMYRLLSDSSGKYAHIFDSLIIIIDPCANPDGRDHYVTWYNAARTFPPTVSAQGYEHNETWHSGRYNHYFTDLNRDLLWEIQPESQQHNRFFRSWMPLFLGDFHEMSRTRSYFFPPHAKPIHKQITDGQKQFQQILGDSLAHLFKRNKWDYFTASVYDMLYPSYGDSYATLQGSVGVTFEQGGINAGIACEITTTDTLTLQQRVEHHIETGLKTIETVFANRDTLLYNQQYFYTPQQNNAYNFYVIKQDNTDFLLQQCINVLQRNRIQYGYITTKEKVTAFSYFEQEEKNVEINVGDIVVPVQQPMHRLVNVLFEPKTYLEDANTYDITAWALPYCMGLNAFAIKSDGNKKLQYNDIQPIVATKQDTANVCVMACKWNDWNDARLLGKLLQNNISVEVLNEKVKTEYHYFGAGSFFVTSANAQQWQKAQTIFNQYAPDGVYLDSVQAQKLLRFDDVSRLSRNKTAVVFDNETEQIALGELWTFFEQQMQYEVVYMPAKQSIDYRLRGFNTVILPSGDYNNIVLVNALKNFVETGGKLIVLEDAIKALSILKTGSLKTSWEGMNIPDESALGAVFKFSTDKDHSFMWRGYNDAPVFVNRRNAATFATPDNLLWWTNFDTQNHVSGYMGNTHAKNVQNTMFVGIEKVGNGQIIYFTDSPIFRNFWQGSYLLFCNALFFGR